MITIDRRGCGCGKTTDPNNGIYKKIKTHYLNEQNVLIVVPSIKLQDQYKKDLNLPIKVINTNNSNNISDVILNSFRNNERIILITHESFTNLTSYGYRNNYHLIIDEALENIFKTTEVFYKKNTNWKPELRFNEIFKPEDNETFELSDDDTWFKFKKYITETDVLINDSPRFKSITHDNYFLYATKNSWQVMNGIEEGKALVINELNPEVLSGYLSVHICSANFEFTYMYKWIKQYKLNHQFITDFTRHTGNIHLHAPVKFKWSIRKLNNEPDVYKQYIEYVNNNLTGQIISIRNNSNTDNYYVDETRISHNAHGLNEYTHINNVSIESAINPNPMFIHFLKNHYGLDDKEITHGFSTHKFYQIIMRTKLRTKTNEPIHIFMIDEDNGALILEYLDITEYHEIDLKYVAKPRGRHIKHMTVEEKQKARKEQNRLAAKKYYEKKKKLSSRDLF